MATSAVLVKEIVAHILFHVDAEAASSDPSQVPGVQERAKLAHDTFSSFENDDRLLEPEDAFTEFRKAVPPGPNKSSLVRTINNFQDSPQLWMHEWVGKNEENRGG